MKLLILDANVIIELFSQNIFSAVLGRYSIKLPKTIKDECKFYTDSNGVEQAIDWSTYIASGKVEEIEASATDFSDLMKKLKDDFYRGIDAGELEAIALICTNADDDLFFCSGDLPSIKAMGVLGKGSQVVSLEVVLQKAGLGRQMKHHFTEKRKTQEITKAFAEKEMYLK